MLNLEKLQADLKKYDGEIEAVNKRLVELDDSKAKLLTHGRRIEGIVAYIRAEIAALQPATPPAEQPAPAPVGEVAAT